MPFQMCQYLEFQYVNVSLVYKTKQLPLLPEGVCPGDNGEEYNLFTELRTPPKPLFAVVDLFIIEFVVMEMGVEI